MTKDHSDAQKAGPSETVHPTPAETPAAAAHVPEEPPVAAPAAPIILVESMGSASAGMSDEPFGFAAAFFLDTTPLTQKSLEIWDENLKALMTHMESLAGVESFEQAVALQTRFATECFESFGRQSRDLVALAQHLASLGVAPLCGTRSTA